MRTFDLTPLFRSTVGFDRMSHLLDAAARVGDEATSYPPYNIEKTGEDAYRVSMAVAGFADSELDITVKEGALIVTGKRASEDGERQFLHRGIATRAFERRFQLADHIQVTDAALENGLLHISLVREVPEEKKPRKIEIVGATAAKTIEGKKAA